MLRWLDPRPALSGSGRSERLDASAPRGHDGGDGQHDNFAKAMQPVPPVKAVNETENSAVRSIEYPSARQREDDYSYDPDQAWTHRTHRVQGYDRNHAAE